MPVWKKMGERKCGRNEKCRHLKLRIIPRRSIAQETLPRHSDVRGVSVSRCMKWAQRRECPRSLPWRRHQISCVYACVLWTRRRNRRQQDGCRVRQPKFTRASRPHLITRRRCSLTKCSPWLSFFSRWDTQSLGRVNIGIKLVSDNYGRALQSLHRARQSTKNVLPCDAPKASQQNIVRAGDQ
jgi:hypothetical protein